MCEITEGFTLEDDPLWYKDAIIYELHVRAFYDSNDDGIGDFAGLTQKLDYLQDLGITAVWLLPFYPSPLKDDGYDIADYTAVHPSYGTVQDFRAFLREAHRRGIRVISELVLNHTSDQHAWFQRARRARHARAVPRASSTYGMTRLRNIKKRASYLKISKPPTGPGILLRTSITGTGFIITSRI